MIFKFQIFLYGIEFKAYTDHEALKYLQTQPFLNCRQMRWVTFLQSFINESTIQYITGSNNGFADWLSRRVDFSEVVCSICQNKLDQKCVQ